MRLLLLTFGFGVVSAVIPIFNMEAYITVVFARTALARRPGARLRRIAGPERRQAGLVLRLARCAGPAVCSGGG